MKHALHDYLFQDPQSCVYALLDGASIANLLRILEEQDPDYVCLYHGELDSALAECAPYLVQLASGSHFTDWILQEGWGHHWGIFAVASNEIKLAALRRHFRRFLRVKDPQGKGILFRYYDPRVLPHYLPTCVSAELAFVYGPVLAFLVEDDDPQIVRQYTLNEQHSLQTRLINLDTAQSDFQLNQRWVTPSNTRFARPTKNFPSLVIRSEQMEVMTNISFKGFENKMVKHVQRFFWAHFNILGVESVHAVIRYGHRRAQSHGFTSQRNVCLYLDLMFMLGSDFDNDPQYPWAREILQDEGLSSPVVRINALNKAAEDYLDQVEGENDSLLQDRWREFCAVPLNNLPVDDSKHLQPKLVVLFKKVYPQKCAVLGEYTLRQLIEYGLKSAVTYHLRSEREITLYMALMFLFGAGCAQDLQFPWIAQALSKEATKESTARVDALQNATTAYLEKRLGSVVHT